MPRFHRVSMFQTMWRPALASLLMPVFVRPRSQCTFEMSRSRYDLDWNWEAHAYTPVVT